MLGPFTPADVEPFARWILAGFVIWTIRNTYVVGERPKIAEVGLDIVLLSVVNQMVWLVTGPAAAALWQAVIDASTKPEHFAALNLSGTALLFAETVVQPAALGLLLGRAVASGTAGRFTGFLQMPSVGPTKRAYDAVFTGIERTVYVIVTLKDGAQVLGQFGPKSHAGRDTDRSEIFLQRIYQLGAGAQWIEFDPPRSALLKMELVRSIEFLDYP